MHPGLVQNRDGTLVYGDNVKLFGGGSYKSHGNIFPGFFIISVKSLIKQSQDFR